MRVAFLVATAPGHGYPMTALARRVKARGHDVVSIGFPSAEPLVRAAGAHVLSLLRERVSGWLESSEVQSVEQVGRTGGSGVHSSRAR